MAKLVKLSGKGDRPRYRYCWRCNRQLRGNHFAEVEVEGGAVVIMHKECAQDEVDGK